MKTPPETPWKPARPLTRKQAAFVKQLVINPKQSATAAVKQVYGKPDKELTSRTAEVIASENLRKPEILAELAKYEGEAESTVIDVMNYSRQQMRVAERDRVAWAVNARQSADSLLDRTRGKATIKTENLNTSVNLNLNLADVIDTP
jgi:phage terminase small subunit